MVPEGRKLEANRLNDYDPNGCTGESAVARRRSRAADRRLIARRSEGRGWRLDRRVFSGRPKGDGREIGAETSFVGCRERPTHYLSMGADEEIEQRYRGRVAAGFRASALPGLQVGLGTRFCDDRRDIKKSNAPTPEPIGNNFRFGVAHTDLREADRIDRRSVLRHPRGDRVPSLFEEGRPIGGGVDQDIRIEEDHGSRVTAFRDSQVIFGCRGAAAIAARQRAMLILGAGFGASRRTRRRRPSPWFWMSKTSPGFASGRTTRRLASAVEIAMVGLSHK